MFDESYYDKVRNELARQYLVIRPLMEVNVRTATNLQENTLKNLKHILHSPIMANLRENLAIYLLFLLVRDPPLMNQLIFSNKIQDRAIIVTSNSPFRKLINSGIRPHLVVTADPLSPTARGFQGVDISDITLACPFSAYPEIVEKFSGNIISWWHI